MEKLPHYLEDIGHELKAIECSEAITPSQIRRYFLLLIRAHWSSAKNFGIGLEDSLSCLEWAEGSDTGVDIQLYGAKPVNDTIPSIRIKFGNIQSAKKTFGGRTDGYERDNATELLEMPCSSQLLFSHYSNATDLSFDMAWTTYCFLVGWMEPIMLSIGASGFEPQLVGEPNLIEPDPDSRFRVDVGAKLNFNVAVATTTESHRLKQIITSVTEAS
jgi:hypothetical protein